MQVTGRSVVLTALAVALVMSGGAWWYHYRASRQAARFWGAEATQLLIGKGEAHFYELGPADLSAPSPPDPAAVAGRAVVRRQDLTEKPGLIHLRHALTQDASFEWSDLHAASLDRDRDWAYAIRFDDGQDRLDILWRSDFSALGVADPAGQRLDVLPCPRLAPAVQTYLRDVGVLSAAKAAR